MSEDKIIIGILPFPNPKNVAEKFINTEVEKIYLDPEMRKRQVSYLKLLPNPDHPFHMYLICAGWTEQGWRVFSKCLDQDTVFSYGEMVVTAEEQLLEAGERLNTKFRSDMRKIVRLN
jgi:hypothetical protein